MSLCRVLKRGYYGSSYLTQALFVKQLPDTWTTGSYGSAEAICDIIP